MTRTLRHTGLPAVIGILLAFTPAPRTSAVEIKLGPVREQTIKWLMEHKGLSRNAAEQMIQKYARRNRAEIIDSVKIPDGAILEFVTLDASQGAVQVRREGCGLFFSPGSEYGQRFLAEVEKLRGTPAYEYFMRKFQEAVERGFFVQKLTDEQRDRLLNAGKRGPLDRPAATLIRILVVSTRMPPWYDVAPSSSNVSHGHPIHPTPYNAARAATHGQTPGGPWSNGQRAGMSNPAWNQTHRGHNDPINGADSFVYPMRSDFVERWFTFLFDYSNPNSVANFFRAESHGNVSISGDRSDIVAWLESHHVLDVNPFGQSYDYTPMPGTPIVREIDPGAPYIFRASVETGQFSVLFRDHGVGWGAGANIDNYRFWFTAGTAPDSPPYRARGTVRRDPTDDRHVTFTGVTYEYFDAGASPPQWRTKTVNNDDVGTQPLLRFYPNGYPNPPEYTYSCVVGQGCPALPNTTITAAEANTALLQSRTGNRLFSMCYYTHDHIFNRSNNSERPYQLSGILNSRGYRDDIMGTDGANLDYHVDRPFPYDHDAYDDTNFPTGGYFGSGHHTTGAWISDCAAVMSDWGVSTAGYQRVIFCYPNGPATMSGMHDFIPQGGGGTVVLPEDAGLALAGHELGHTFGMVDLYDLDFYANNASPPPDPRFFESDAMGPYSIMANGGVRVDAWHKILLGWAVPTLLAREQPPGSGNWVPSDARNAPIPEIEGTLQNPTIYKAVPDYATGNITGGQEYFLIENRNRPGYFGDPSPRGMYIYHIDGRFPQRDELYFAVIVEQADGLYQLEKMPRGWNAGRPDAMAGDPFPGSNGVRLFTQWTNPSSRAHGQLTAGGKVVPGSSYDSFFRVDNISDPAAVMRANLWVQPAELVATAINRARPTAYQGDKNVPILQLQLNNDPNPPNLSQNDVVIREIIIDESGNSKNDNDVARALVYEDIGGDGKIVSGTDVLLATAPVVNQMARLSGLSYRVPLGTVGNLLIAFDIADTAQTSPPITVGAGIDHADPNYDPANPWSCITCQVPGVIQERVRTGVGTYGASRFPLRSDADKVVILEAPDTLTVTPKDIAPASVLQGTTDVGMLAMRLSVDRDSVILESLRVDARGSSTRPGDVSAKLYEDANLNSKIDPGETVIDTATFYINGPETSAVFDSLGGFTVVPGTNRGLIVAYDFAADATPNKTVSARLANRQYITLRDAADRVATTNFPMTSSYTRILRDTRPMLRALDGGTRNWLSPTRGTPITQFTWEAIYTDAENDPPSFIQVVIDDVAYPMQPVNPVDTNYTDGANFRLQRRLPVGNHVYYITASDGASTVRYPPVAPDVYPQPIVTNNPPTLANATVTPARGDATTAFLYEITFADVDGHPAAYVNVMIDGGAPLPMTEQDPSDTNTRDGKVYELLMPAGSFTPGAHKAKFEASDGFDVVSYPKPGEMTGPILSSPSTGFFADSTYAPFAGPLEEGDKVFIQVQDIDQNLDVGARDTLNVTVTVLSGGDTETITLRETATDSGIFRTWPGGVQTYGGTGSSGDGVINVAAGRFGNTLRLRYTDPFDNTDTLTRNLRVIDTKAPAIVRLVDLAAAANPDGTVINVDFTAYDEASQADVARYEVFLEDAPAPIGGLTPAATLSAGTRTVQLPTGGPGPDKYVAVAVYDEVPNVNPDVKWRKVSTSDSNPPSVIGENPADGSTEVPLDTDITFRVDDAGSGVMPGDIRVRIRQDPADGGAWTDVTASLVIGGAQSSRTVAYDPPQDFLYNQRVYVEVSAKDVAGNAMTRTFSFLTAADVNAPVVQNAQPADGDTNVPVDTNIAFELADDRSGIDPASIRVTVNGTNVTPSLQIGGTATLITVLYDPPTDFNWGQTVTVTVDAADVAGNVMSTVLYTFTILPDTSGVVIDQLMPADGATDVPINTNISFRASDATSGVNKASVQLLINDVQIPLTDANFVQVSPTAYVVTYDPPADFPYRTTVKVRATARDLAGNSRTGVTWHFRTEPPPVYSITGKIEETVNGDSAAAKVGVPGVRVNIIDYATGKVVQTAISVGTGVYEATGLLDGTYVVEPTLTDYTFTSRKTGKPTQRVYVGLRDTDGDGYPQLDASGVDFDATRTLYAIVGRIMEGSVGLPGVQVTDGTRTATTDADGRYRIEGVPSGTYTVTPSLTNYTFNPTSQTAVVKSANATGIDFTATARTFSISGTIQDALGNRLAGVKVEVEGGTSVAVTSQAGQYTLTGVKAGLRTVIVSREGYVFEPAPGVATTAINVTQDLTGIDFIGYPVLTRSFAAGTHFVGVPVVPRDDDPAAVFGTQLVARWAGTASPPHYVTASSDPGHDALKVKPGAGFFVRYGQPKTIQVAGTPIPTAEPYVILIDEGWTMAANPFPSAIGFANLRPNTPNSMAPYGFVLENGQYTIVSNISALGGRRWIDAWEGVWLLGDVPSASITVLPPGATTAGLTEEQPKRVVDRNNWRIPIVAQAAGTTDACSVVGVSAATGAVSVANPPPIPDAVDVVIHGTNDEALACDLKAKATSRLVWRFSVITSTPDTDVQVLLPDLSEVPEDLTVTLVDVAANKSVFARTTAAYVYSSGRGGAREFRLEVEPRVTTGLTIRTTGVQTGPALVAVNYVVSAQAQISARVLNIAGRQVRTLVRGAMVSAGANTLNWDLTSDAHTRVPRGRYLVEIEAISADGQRATAIQSLTVDR